MKRQNTLLLIIAILLALNVLVKIFPIRIINADSGIQKVNIVKIGGSIQYGKVIEVEVK